MNQLLLFKDRPDLVDAFNRMDVKAMVQESAPIARHSDPTTSHKAAERIQPTITARQLQCLEVLRDFGQPMTSNELAKACCDRFCSELAVDPVQFAKKLDNYRKRADEIKRNPELCEILEAERNGGQLFKARASK